MVISNFLVKTSLELLCICQKEMETNGPSVPICSGGPAVLTVKCQHRFNLQWIHRDTYWRLRSSILLHICYSPRFVNFPINFNHNWWEFLDCLPLGDDRSQSHYATKNQYSSKIYESFYLEPGAKNIDDPTGRWLHSSCCWFWPD